MKVRLIVNPAAGRGLGARRLPAAREALLPLGADVQTTAGPGDEVRLAREALDDGCDVIAVLGGDGTWSNVSCELVRARSDCAVALLDAGTGSDFSKSVGAPARDFAATAALVASGASVRVDAARVGDVPFINVAGFGFDASVIEAMAGVRWLRGNALYLYAAARQLFGYRGFGAALDPASGGTHEGRLALVAANGRRFGGAFTIAPTAALDDGRLDFVEIGPAAPLRRVVLFGAATRGTHVRHPEVRERRAERLCVRFDAPPVYEADGELRRAPDAEVEIACLARAFRVVADGIAARHDGAILRSSPAAPSSAGAYTPGSAP